MVEHIRAEADKDPPFTDAQRGRLAVLLLAPDRADAG
jgi:hypothetical protein